MQRTVTTRGVVWRGGEKGRNTIHGGRERGSMIYTVEPFGSCDTLCPWTVNSRLHVRPPNVRLLVENRGTRGIAWLFTLFMTMTRLVARPTLSTLHELFLIKPKKEERKGEKRIVRTDSTRNKLFIIPTRIPTTIYPWSILRTDEKLPGETVRVTNNRYPRLARSRATWIFWYRDEKWRRANARGPPVLRANGLLH